LSVPFLATDLDGEIVLLDVARARLFKVDAWTRQVWEACEGGTTAGVTSALRAPARRVTGTLTALADAGLVRQDRGRWLRVAVRWV